MGSMLGGIDARPARVVAALSCALALTIGLGLAGCTTEATPEPTTPSEQPPSEEEPEGDPAAIVTIAAVDVDGLHVTVAGFVTELGESGGQCQFTLTSVVSGTTVTVETTGEDNSSSTTCGSAQVAVSELSRGPWDVVLYYSSPAATLESEAERVEVP